MLDAYTSDGKYAFQFDMLEDLYENWDDYGLPSDIDLNDFGGPNDGALVILVPSGQGGWYYEKLVSADDLQKALAQAGLLPD